MPTDVDTLFQQAVKSYGSDYLSAEKALRDGGETTTTALRQKQADQSLSALQRFIAATVADWIDGKGDDVEMLLGELDKAGEAAKESILREPRPDAAAGLLNNYSRLDHFFALRLLKQSDWPHWQVMAILIYLFYFADVDAIAAVKQFTSDVTEGFRKDKTPEEIRLSAGELLEKMEQTARDVAEIEKSEAFGKTYSEAEKATGPDKQTADLETILKALDALDLSANRDKLEEAQTLLQRLIVEPVVQATEGVVDENLVRQTIGGLLMGAVPEAPTTEKKTSG